MLRRLVCRLRGHHMTDRTLRMDDREREVEHLCLRCRRTFGRRIDPLLLTLESDLGWFVTLRCYATGETGECGHPLAECEGGRCGGVFCPTCGQWRCASCEAVATRFQSLLAEGAARMDELMGIPSATDGLAADAAVLRGDWQRVGGDMRRAAERVLREARERERG